TLVTRQVRHQLRPAEDLLLGEHELQESAGFRELRLVLFKEGLDLVSLTLRPPGPFHSAPSLEMDSRRGCLGSPTLLNDSTAAAPSPSSGMRLPARDFPFL